MKTSAEIREEMGRQLDRAQALNDLAAGRENGEATAEEKAELVKILGKGKAGEKDYQAGIIGTLEAELDTAEKFEARVAQLAAKRQAVKPQQGEPNAEADEDADPSAAMLAKVRIPASARYSHANLKAFR